jgi:crotonobetainyl-CoA:carnitine CoA-transferase CaiB-like acyl-CoA transferase
MAENKPPLSGIVVADFATNRAELAGRLLGELGAEVFHIEPPGGAEARRLPPFDERVVRDENASLHWISVAAGKASLVVDLEDATARGYLRPLLERADILVESFDPGEMRRLGLDYAEIAKFNPGIAYVSVTPYGQDGPDAHSPATELTLEAAGGLLGMQGDGDRPPVPVGYPQAAFHAGAQAAADAVIALSERQHSGRGQHLDVSMQAAVVWTLMNATGYPPNTGGDPPAYASNRKNEPAEVLPGIRFPKLYECLDGYLTCQLAGGRVGKQAMQTALGWAAREGTLPERLAGRDWSNWAMEYLAGTIPPEDVFLAIETVSGFFKRHSQHELMQLGTDGGLLLAPILKVDAVRSDPQLEQRQYWVEVEGRTQPGIPVRFSKTPMVSPKPAPKLGQHQERLSGPFADRIPAPTRPQAARSRAFEGLKIADFAWIGVGPIIGKAFADHGATVIHVESPSRPDLLRTIPPFKDGIPGLDRAQFMANFNSSKLGLTLNLHCDAGLDLAKRLIAWSDVVAESFTAGAFARLGLGYDVISRDRPDLVMLSTCLRGQSGPQCSYGGYGGQGAALAGIFGTTGWPDRPPCGPWGAYTDFIAPRYGVAALASALLHRELTGEGQHIDLAQVEAAIHFIEPVVLDHTVNGRVMQGHGHESPYASPHGIYRAAGEERYVTIACETGEQWRALGAIAPLEAFAGPEFDDLAKRLAHDDAIDAALERWCADQEPGELVARLKRAGVPAAEVLYPTDLYRDAQLTHRDFFKVLDHTVMGPTPYDGPVTLFSETPPAYTAAPCLGEHTEQVLREILGLSDGEIAEYAEGDAFS